MASWQFQKELDGYVRKASQAHKRGAHHDYLRHVFSGFVHDAFGLKYEDMDIETGVKYLRGRGRIDALYKDIILDFKTDLDSQRQEGQTKLKQYIETFPYKERVFGILTDGLVFEVYVLCKLVKVT